MGEIFKKYKFKITAMSPIHIGSSESAVDMSWYVKSGKLIKRLKEESYILKNFSNVPPKLEYQYSLTDELGGIERIPSKKSVRTLIRHPDGRVYIPASSLKGSIRIALIHFYLKQNDRQIKALNREVERAIERAINDKRIRNKRNLMRNDKKLARFIEGVLRYDFKDQKYGSSLDPKHDVMRAIRISDSTPSSEMAGMYRFGILKKNGKRRDMSLIEAIKPGTVFEFDVTVDVDLLKKFSDGFFVKENPDDLMETIEKALKEHLKPVKELEKEFLKLMRNMTPIIDRSNIRFGWGSGILATTVFNLLKDDLKKRVLKILNPRISHLDLSEPITRKVIIRYDSSGNLIPHFTLGWAKLEIL